MDNNEAYEYFGQLATNYVPISHTTQKPRFGRFDLDEMNTKLREGIDVTNFCLLMETPTGGLEDNGGDGYFDNQDLAFWIVKQVPLNNYKQERDTLHEARQHGTQLVLKCWREMPGADRIDLSKVEYDKVGPVFGNCYGYRFSFMLPDTLDMSEDASLWKNG